MDNDKFTHAFNIGIEHSTNLPKESTRRKKEKTIFIFNVKWRNHTHIRMHIHITNKMPTVLLFGDFSEVFYFYSC